MKNFLKKINKHDFFQSEVKYTDFVTKRPAFLAIDGLYVTAKFRRAGGYSKKGAKLTFLKHLLSNMNK
jgi:hypothetical protein